MSPPAYAPTHSPRATPRGRLASAGRAAALSLAAAVAVAVAYAPNAAATGGAGLSLDVHRWRVVTRDSGPVNYYRVVDDPAMPFLRAEYRAPLATTVLGFQLPDEQRTRARRLSWSWRAQTLPRGANECAKGAEDAAATVYATWKRGLRWYTLKYQWSSIGAKGSVCNRKRNPLVAQQAVILESGGPLNEWRRESLDLDAEFRKHFAGGDPQAEVPPFVGVGILTDGDQTGTDSAADYAAFVVSP
ncbi:MAG TPA: DUF3047 domain-containing protein [Polyangiaceae bacterium]|nr:DUF3047 domain-containing protein [Polyangiaceae bacterium]